MAWLPLQGVRILDLSRLLPGPFMTQILSDLGAEVIKIEEPGSGDGTRWMPPEGFAFGALNKGKRSVAIDLKVPGAAEVVLRIASRCDAMVESFRPGVLDRLGLSDAAFARANAKLVRLSLSGYPEGEWRNDAGHDINYVALAGILGAQDHGPLTIADLGGALYGAIGLLAALKEGRGQRIEVSLMDAALGLNSFNLARAAAGGAPKKGEWELAGGLPGYAVYVCRDGRSIAVGALEAKFLERLEKAVGEVSAATFLQRDRDEWVRLLRDAGVPATPALSTEEALALHAGRAHASAPFGAPRGAPPELGADADGVLSECGFSAADVARLRATGVLG